MKQYKNLKQALKDGYKIYSISYYQCIENFLINCYLEDEITIIKTNTHVSFFTKEIPKYIKITDFIKKSTYLKEENYLFHVKYHFDKN